jgi:hypothetical protein
VQTKLLLAHADAPADVDAGSVYMKAKDDVISANTLWRIEHEDAADGREHYFGGRFSSVSCVFACSLSQFCLLATPAVCALAIFFCPSKARRLSSMLRKTCATSAAVCACGISSQTSTQRCGTTCVLLLVKKIKILTRYFGGSVRLRHLVTDQYLGTQFYLLYWYKSTSTDAIGGAGSAAARVFDGACERRGRMRTYADVC